VEKSQPGETVIITRRLYKTWRRREWVL